MLVPACFCQPSGLDGGFTGVLTTIAGPRIGHDDAHPIFLEFENVRQLFTDTEGPLCAGPGRELTVGGPFSDGGTVWGLATSPDVSKEKWVKVPSGQTNRWRISFPSANSRGAWFSC
jgi:hypothetical protein